MNDIIIVDGFLNSFDNFFIEEQVLETNSHFPWHFHRKTTSIHKNFDFFVRDISVMQHCFYENGKKYSNKNKIIDIFKKTFCAYGIDFDTKIIRMNCNLVRPIWDLRHTPFHVDRKENHIVCIYYLNQVGGKTIIKNNQKINTISPIKNRCIIFNGNFDHCHKLIINSSRVVFNFNFKIN